MQVAQFGMKPLADRPAVPDDDGSDERIRTNPATSALRQLECPLEVLAIPDFEGVGHLD
jgi:hypothetical protein